MSNISVRLAGAVFALSVLVVQPASANSRKAAPARAPERQKPAPNDEAPVAKGRLYAVVLGPGPAWKRGQPFRGPGLAEHRRYWKKLLDEGRVASAGPLGNDTGLVLLRARSQSEADGLVAGDPAVKARLLRGIARPYAAELINTPVLVGR